MLLGGKQADIKQVAIITRNQQFNRLLSRILADWKYVIVEDVSVATVIFAERGLELPSHNGHVVWLTPLPLSEGSFLTVPISLTRLYRLLEAQFFPTPRRQVRVTLETAVDMKIENDWLEGRLVSLSKRGGRIACANEISRGKLLQVEVKLADRTLRLHAEALYCVPAGDSPGRSQPQVGVIFKPPNDEQLGMLQRFIEKTCIECACAREDIPFSDPCVSWIDVPVDPWSE
jgi:hypothetical protein